jgi:hypothetical protein
LVEKFSKKKKTVLVRETEVAVNLVESFEINSMDYSAKT